MDDRVLAVLVFASRGVKKGSAQTVSPAGLKDFLLSSSIRVKPSKSDFLKLSEDEQNRLKNGTAFIFGTSSDGSRRSGSITSRSAVALDVDALPPEKAADLFQRIKGVPFTVLLYGTARDSAACRRLRLLVPLAADITAAEYPAVARGVAAMLLDGIATPDEASFQPQQLMYAPISFSGAPADVAEHPGALLAPATIRPADNGAEAAQDIARQAAQQQLPTDKIGVVGAFCRVYDVPAAIEKFLPDVYSPCEGNRFTFNAGSSAAGAILYQDGQFLYSHHATDPASGKLCNSFDLVRIHLFGAQDVLAAPGVAPPSYEAMERLAREDAAVQRQLVDDRAAETQADFAAVPTAPQPTALQAAVGELHRTAANKAAPTLDTYKAACLVLFNGELPCFNDQTHSLEIPRLGNIPPESRQKQVGIGLRDVLTRAGIVKGTSPDLCNQYFLALAHQRHVHPAADWLAALAWDGTDRFPVLDEVLHIEGDALSQTFVRRWFVQAAALACNRDGHAAGQFCLTLAGPQGIGKTSFFRKICPNPDWFLEGARLDVSNKDSIIQATDSWIVELGELDATTKKEQPALKSFLSNRWDVVRRPYDPAATKYPRRTVFCATVNNSEFLRDETGNRRFAVLELASLDLDKLDALTDDFIAQLWSQAFDEHRHGAPYFLDRDTQAEQEKRNLHFEAEAPFQGEILDMLDTRLPPEQWRLVTAAAVAEHVHNGCTAVTAGRAIRKIARQIPGISQKSDGARRLWLLPMKSIFLTGSEL